jgi:two-component system nitrate/nitrite response regulator NarP
VVANSFGKVALLSDDLGRDFVYESLELGVMGFIPKTLSLQALGHAIKLVSSGVPFIPVDFFKTSKQSDQINNFGLTPNEFDVLRKLAMGYSNKEIMAALDISDSAIKMRVRSLTRKLGARNRTHAVILAREARLLD